MVFFIFEVVFFGDCDFFSVNFVVKFFFGEDVFVNVFIERIEDGYIIGYVRIRSKI